MANSIKLISFLGTGQYNKTTYTHPLLVDTDATHYVQKAVYKLVQKKHPDKDITLHLALTEKARKVNYENNAGATRYNTNEKPLSLYSDDYNIIPFDIKEGASTEELWANFNIIYNLFEKDDLVYFDITHSFRSLPLMFTSILSYAEAMKNVCIGGVFYGAFEFNNQEDASTPIFDLTPFITINNFTKGATTLVQSADAKPFYDEARTVLLNLKERHLIEKKQYDAFFSLNRQYCNFFNALSTSDIIGMSNAYREFLEPMKKLQQDYQDTDVIPNELLPLMSLYKYTQKIFKDFIRLDTRWSDPTYLFKDTTRHKICLQLINNTHAGIQLAMEHRLYQQAATMLLENLISIIALWAHTDRKTAREILNRTNRSERE